MPNLPTKPGVRPLALLLAALFAAAAVAGCLGSDERDDDENGDEDPFEGGFEPRPTHPALDIVLAAPEESWAGEDVTIDGSGSSAMDARIVSWTFDLGDGTVIELSGDEVPVVDHNYTAGGVYQVNLTAEARSGDDANQNEEETDGNETDEADGNESAFGGSGGSSGDEEPIVETASRFVVVHDRFVVEESELEAGLSSGDSQEHGFVANDGATNLTVNLSIESTDFLMDAEGTVRVLDPAGEALVEETFSTDGEQTLEFEGTINATGEHLLEVELESGAITYDGTIEVAYSSEADTGEEDTTEEDEE